MTKKELKKRLDEEFTRQGNRVQFNIMDLGKVLREAEADCLNGLDPEIAMADAIAKYRIN